MLPILLLYYCRVPFYIVSLNASGWPSEYASTFLFWHRLKATHWWKSHFRHRSHVLLTSTRLEKMHTLFLRIPFVFRAFPYFRCHSGLLPCSSRDTRYISSLSLSLFLSLSLSLSLSSLMTHVMVVYLHEHVRVSSK